MINKKNLKNRKKGLSEIVSYILLIMIALSIAGGVYAFMKSYIIAVPKKCPENLALILVDYKCERSVKTINLTLQNKGLFNIDGFLVRVSNISGGIAKDYLKTSVSGVRIKEIFFLNDTNLSQVLVLKPNEKYITPIPLDYGEYNSISKIEIQPFIKEPGRGIIVCDNIVSQPVDDC